MTRTCTEHSKRKSADIQSQVTGRLTGYSIQSLSKNYKSVNDRYGLLSSDLWVHTGFHCGKRMEVFMDGKWILSRMEMNPKREWYLVETPYSGNLEYIRVRIEE